MKDQVLLEKKEENSSKKLHKRYKVLTRVSPTVIESKAATVKLFDGSIWVNMRDGTFIMKGTNKYKLCSQIYPKIRSAVNYKNKKFAGRKNINSALYFVPEFRVENLE